MQTRRDVFQAISDPTRREIIGLLARQALNLNAIAENFDVSRPAISQHIKILTECGLIVVRKQGRERYCAAKLRPLHEVADWVEKFRQAWAVQFDALDDLLDELKATGKSRPAKASGRGTTKMPAKASAKGATKTPAKRKK